MAARHDVVPEIAGAVVVAVLLVTTTSAESSLPWSSVTDNTSVKEPLGGATTVATAVSAPLIATGPDQLYEAMLRPQAAALADASSTTFWPGDTDTGTATAATGRSAAWTLPGASAMPAPQVVVVQSQPNCPSGSPTWHCGTPVAGNGRAASRRRAINCARRRLPLTDCMRPAMPATCGAEKLVPDVAVELVGVVEAAATVVPVLIGGIEGEQARPRRIVHAVAARRRERRPRGPRLL